MNQLKDEHWREIPDTNGRYLVSDKGEVWSCGRGRLLKAYPNTQGYLNLRVRQGGKLKMVKVARLVAWAFVANPHKKKEVNHIDGNVKNNRYENLEWVTRSENELHAINSLGYKPAKNLKNKKVPDDALPEITALRRAGHTLPSIGKLYGVTGAAIWNILKQRYGKTTF